MLDKILVPLDGSPLADQVLPHLIGIVQATQSQVTLLRVLEQNEARSAPIDPVDWHLCKAGAQTHLEEVSARLAEFDLQPAAQLLEGPAAQRIIEYAQKQDFDLILLSSHGQGGLSSWNTSGVAQKIINRARRSIMLVRAYQDGDLPADEREMHGARYARIFVPLDGSQRAECVLPLATALARHHNAALILAHVVVQPELIQRTPLTAEDTDLIERVVARNKTEIIKYFDQLQARLSPEPDIRIVVSEHAVNALHELAQNEQADLVILSAHGYSGQRRRAYGSLATSFLVHGTAPLIIVQDLEAHEIEMSQAELAFESHQKRSKERIINHGYAPI